MAKQEFSGWPFDVKAAQQLESVLRTEMDELADRMRATFPYVDGGQMTPKRANATRGYIKDAPFTKLKEFRQWLRANDFDPDEKALTIGHPQVAQVDLARSFRTTDYKQIWTALENHLDVYKIRTSAAEATDEYSWSDPDYPEQQQRSVS